MKRIIPKIMLFKDLLIYILLILIAFLIIFSKRYKILLSIIFYIFSNKIIHSIIFLINLMFFRVPKILKYKI